MAKSFPERVAHAKRMQKSGVDVTTDPRIETQRLVLRVPRIEDFERYAELQAHEQATRYIGGQMERVGLHIYLLTPANAQVSEEDRRRLEARGS